MFSNTGYYATVTAWFPQEKQAIKEEEERARVAMETTWKLRLP